MTLWNDFRHHFGIQNRFKICWKLSQNRPAHLKPYEDPRKCCQDVSRSLSEGPKRLARRFKRLPRSFKIGSPKLSRRLFWSQCKITTHDSQCAPHKLHSWVYGAFKNFFLHENLSTYSSQFAVHRTYFPFIDTTVCISQLAVHTQMLIVHRLGLASLKYVFHNAPISWCPALPCTAYWAICISLRVRGSLHHSQCAMLTSEFGRP